MNSADSPFAWDEDKEIQNQNKHGVPLSAAVNFDFAGALVIEDTRRDYGEKRFVAYGNDLASGKLMSLCFTPRDGKLRFISYRMCRQREIALKKEFSNK